MGGREGGRGGERERERKREGGEEEGCRHHNYVIIVTKVIDCFHTSLIYRVVHG